MAYITAAEVKVIRDELKKEFPEIKFSVTREHHSAIRVAIMAAPYAFVEGKGNATINPYYLTSYQNSDKLAKMIEIINRKNYDNSDVMTDYFDVGYYVHIEQGKWDKPFVLTK